MGPRPVKTTPSSIEELALAILKTYKEPMPGSLFLQKLAFICIKEIADLHHLLHQADYKPKQYGPFSGSLRDAVESLVRKGLAFSTSVPSDQYRKDLIGLTPKGAIEADLVLSKTSDQVLGELTKKCRGAKQLGYSGLLRYVYAHYPDATSESKIRQKVFESFGRYSY
jgi:uncharacterized protein YwgA